MPGTVFRAIAVGRSLRRDTQSLNQRMTRQFEAFVQEAPDNAPMYTDLYEFLADLTASVARCSK